MTLRDDPVVEEQTVHVELSRDLRVEEAKAARIGLAVPAHEQVADHLGADVTAVVSARHGLACHRGVDQLPFGFRQAVLGDHATRIPHRADDHSMFR